MKQLTKSGEILGKLRAAYGVDANVDNLAVYEVVLANTQPIRKTGGLFKGAQLATALLAEIVNSINAESIPLQLQHDTNTVPFGRVFSAALVGEEARGLIAVDKTAHPDIVQKLDNGTLDQVSLGMVNKHLLCSSCGFDYTKPEAYQERFDLSCDKGHRIGEAGVHLKVVGLETLFETSLVGYGAVRGARILGPTESAFEANPRLAASVAEGNNRGDIVAVRLTATVEENTTMDLATAFAQNGELSTKLGVAQANLTTAEATVTQLRADLNAATEAKTAAETELNTLKTGDLATALSAKETAEAAVSVAVEALAGEAKLVLTALGKKEDEITAELKDKDVPALLSILTANRAQFAAIVPAGGASAAADAGAQARRPLSAFRAPATNRAR